MPTSSSAVRWLRLAWAVTAAAVFAALPSAVRAARAAHWSLRAQACLTAGAFVALALPVSVAEVGSQLAHYARPRLQIRVVRILWMVPVYALNSWFALRFANSRLYLDAVRECYEAYVIYNFFMYLRAYLEDEYGDLDAYFATKDDVPHLGPLARLLPPWRMGAPFFRECQQGVLAYVVVRPLMTAANLLAASLGVAGDGELRPDRAFVWATAANNASQLWALYCLVLFYTATRHELAPLRPLAKFVVVKAVVFLSYWQGIAIAVGVWAGAIRAPAGWQGDFDVDGVAAGLQEWLICVEMFFAALAHAHAFPASDYADPGAPPGPAWAGVGRRLSGTLGGRGGGGGGGGGVGASLRAMFAVDDVVHDVSGAAGLAAARTAGALGAAGAGAWDATRSAGAAALGAPAALLGAVGTRLGGGGGGGGGAGGAGASASARLASGGGSTDLEDPPPPPFTGRLSDDDGSGPVIEATGSLLPVPPPEGSGYG